MNAIPTVIKHTPHGERVCDIFSLLSENRIISLSGEVNDLSAELVMAQLLYLDSLSHDPIMLYINSPGGSVTAGMVIHDTMKTIRSKVHTVCCGIAASMGAFLLAAGDMRSALENAEIMIHQPLGGAQGQASDVLIHAEHLKRTKERLNRLLSEYTGQSLTKIQEDTDRDNYLSARDALVYGLIDDIIHPCKK